MLLLLDRESFQIPTRARNKDVDDSCYVHARAYTYMYTDECVYFCILTLLMSAHRYNVEKLAHWVDKEAPGWAKSKAFFPPRFFRMESMMRIKLEHLIVWFVYAGTSLQSLAGTKGPSWSRRLLTKLRGDTNCSKGRCHQKSKVGSQALC